MKTIGRRKKNGTKNIRMMTYVTILTLKVIASWLVR